MSAAIYVGLGAGAGALLGAGAGMAIFRKTRGKAPVNSKAKDAVLESNKLEQNEVKPKAVEAQKASKTVAAAAAGPAAAPGTAAITKHEKTAVVDKVVVTSLFDTNVTYLTRASEFYTPLVRFEIYLQAPQERKSFARAVEHIDHFLGMDALLNGRSPVARGALPTIAQSARNKTLRILDDIIAFSFEDRASPTKREAMQEIRNELAEIMDEMISDMLKLIAASTI